MEKKESAKERILRVAGELFYREGIRAVGIDRIIQESGVAKASFYRSFATKDDLVAEYLEVRIARALANVSAAREAHPDSPFDQLYWLLDYLVERMQLPDYRGCPFMNASVEFPEQHHPNHLKAVAFRNRLWDGVTSIVLDLGVERPLELSEQLRMLYSGAIVVAYMNRGGFQASHFRSAAQALIDSHPKVAA